MWPRKLFIIVYVQYNDSLTLPLQSQIRHCRCNDLYWLFIMYYALVDFHVTNLDANRFLFF